jgi:hypothetical protein
MQFVYGDFFGSIDPMQALAEWRKQVAVPVMQALDREVANSAARLSSRRDAFHVCSRK